MEPPAPGQPLMPSPAQRAAAGDWPLRNVSRETPSGAVQLHLVCALPECDQSIACYSTDINRGSFILSPDAICARVLAHIRVCHADSVPAT